MDSQTEKPKQNFDLMKLLKVAPVLLKIVSKHWNELTQAWELLKPTFKDIAEELRNEEKRNK